MTDPPSSLRSIFALCTLFVCALGGVGIVFLGVGYLGQQCVNPLAIWLLVVGATCSLGVCIATMILIFFSLSPTTLNKYICLNEIVNFLPKAAPKIADVFIQAGVVLATLGGWWSLGPDSDNCDPSLQSIAVSLMITWVISFIMMVGASLFLLTSDDPMSGRVFHHVVGSISQVVSGCVLWAGIHYYSSSCYHPLSVWLMIGGSLAIAGNIFGVSHPHYDTPSSKLYGSMILFIIRRLIDTCGIVWLIIGSVWVFGMKKHHHCNSRLYLWSFWYLLFMLLVTIPLVTNASWRFYKTFRRRLRPRSVRV